MTTFQIRRLTASDALEFKRVRLRSLAEHPDAFTATLAEWDLPLEKFVERIQLAHVLGGFDATGQLLGHVVLATHLATAAKAKHKCEIWSVYVIPDARGTGLARALLEEALREGQALGYDWLKLQVAEHNAPARRLYESLGFIAYGREEDHLRLPDGRSITEVLMQKRL